jgi:thiamine pyrophosphate-dependent acetolactate synthase large subunit-like protein
MNSPNLVLKLSGINVFARDSLKIKKIMEKRNGRFAIEEEVVPTSIPITRVAPEPDEIAQAASMLVKASKPMIIVGDGVASANAQAELTQVTELVGAQVWGSDSSEPNMSATHPLYGGLLGHMFGEVSSRITSQADVVLTCGTYVFPEVFPALSEVFAPGVKIVHIDLRRC